MPCFEFISPWFDYHDTFSSYSFPAHSPMHSHQVTDITLPECTSHNQKVSSMCFLHPLLYQAPLT
jgi:hypothetical protein